MKNLAYLAVGLAVLTSLWAVLTVSLTDWGIATVKSGSMEPAIPTGSMLVVAPAAPDAIKVGDTILYWPPGGSGRVTHRVVDVDTTGREPVFFTQGDANTARDPYSVPAGNVIGKVHLTIPYMGTLANFIQTRTGFIVLFALPAVALAALVIRDIVTFSPKNKRRARLLELRRRQHCLNRTCANR
jgi:signal peptidase